MSPVLGSTYDGRYLLCRTTSPAEPIDLFNVSVTIIDLEGSVARLALYHLPQLLRPRTPLWPSSGSIFIIQNPAFKMLAKIATVVVDDPSSIIFVYDCDRSLLENTPWYSPQTLSVEELKTKGGDMVRQKKYEDALGYYDQALLLDPENSALLLNKWGVFWQLERFRDAYNLAFSAYGAGLEPDKWLWRLGQTAYKLRDFRLAREHFTTMLEQGFQPGQSLGNQAKCDLRIRESETGCFDIQGIALGYLKAHTAGQHFSPDAADYIGPIEVREIPGKGRGTVALTRLPKGTLILGGKAFGHSGTHNPSEVRLIPSISGRTSLREVTQKLAGECARQIIRDPAHASAFYSLYAGPNIDRNQTLPERAVDLERIQEICCFNAFQEDNFILHMGRREDVYKLGQKMFA
jgi:tetratricopeptide (TPR) repeat protein